LIHALVNHKLFGVVLVWVVLVWEENIKVVVVEAKRDALAEENNMVDAVDILQAVLL
jgi:hypothetical protein